MFRIQKRNILVMVGAIACLTFSLTHPGWRSDLKAQTGYTVLVPVDIKPEACPNQLNANGRGTINVAIVGTPFYNLADIDRASIRLLDDIAPEKSTVEDVSTPFDPEVVKETEDDCNDFGPDTVLDLKLQFKSEKILEKLGDVNDGDVMILKLTGRFIDDTLLEGSDVVVIKKPGPKK